MSLLFVITDMNKRFTVVLIFCLSVLAILHLSNCTEGPFAPDLNGEYSISGTVYRGVTDSAFSGLSISLEGEYREITNIRFEDLGTANTDENGQFEIKYKQIISDNKASGNGSIINATFKFPRRTLDKQFSWNQTISKDFYHIDSSHLFFEISFVDTVPDTLFMYMPFDIQGELISIPQVSDQYSRPAFLFKVENEKVVIPIKVLEQRLIDTTAMLKNFVYGYNREDFQIQMTKQVFTDSLSPSTKVGQFSYRGHPFIDTIRLEL